MARSSQGIALVAAVAAIGGLAWWMLKPADGPGPIGEGTSPAPAVTEGAGTGPAKAPAPKAAPSRPVGILLAVVKGDGKPLAATLSAVPADDLHAEPASATGSAEDGAVRLAAVPAGVKLRVTVAAAGWRTAVLADAEIAAGGEKDLGVLVLERALPATGRVLDPAGKPVAGATVGALPSETAPRFDFRRLADLVLNEPDWKAKATTREDGTFTLDALGPGTWNLVATAPGFSPSAEQNVLLHPAGAAPPVDLVLQQGYSLTLKVVGPADAPVTGAEASAATTGGRMGLPVSMGPARGITDAGGEARLSGISPGRTIVAVRASGGRLSVRTVEVPVATAVTVRLGGTAALVVKVRTAEGGAVEGASVMAMVQGGAGGMDSGEALTASTGADGSVKWERLPAGRLAFVLVEKEGFPPVTPDGGGGMMGGEELKADATLEKEIVLKAGVAVSGIVRRRPGDSPVAGAKVTASGGAFVFGGQPLRATADADGAYRIEGLAEGRVQLSAAAEGLAPPEAWSAGGNPFMGQQEGQPLPEGLVMVAVGAGDLKKDLLLEETGSVAGRVLGPSGDGIGGARVDLSTGQGLPFRGFGFPGGGGDSLPGPVLTGPDGAFLVKGVPAGQNLIARAGMPGFLGAVSAPFTLAAGGSAAALEIRLTEGGVLAGRVTAGSGSPVAGAKVRADARQGRPGGRMVNMTVPGSGGQLTATTGADGTWRIATVPPGTMAVTVEAEGFVDATRADLSVAAGVETRADISLEAGRVIAGTVKDSTGAAVEGARVFARSAEGTAPEAMKFKQGTTDAAGAFRLGGLPAGTFILTVNAPGNAARTIPDIAAGNESLDIRLAPAVRMSGKVVDPEGNPVAGARINATSEGTDGVSGGGRSGTDGAFVIEGLVAGTFRVTAQGADRKFARAEAKGVAGDASGLLLTLPRALEIRGKVAGPDGGVPAEQGFVVATSASGEGRSSARWEPDGSFVVAGLSEGSYTLRAMVPGKFEGTATAVAGSTGVSLRLEASAATGPGGGNGVPVPIPAGPRPPR